MRGQLAVVELLLKHGAKVRISDYENETAAYYAGCTRHDELFKLLLLHYTEEGIEHLNEIEREAFRAVMEEDGTRLEKCIDQGVDLEKTDADGMTLLMLACNGETKAYEMVDLLLKRGFHSIDSQTHDLENTALTIAASNNDLKTVRLLVENHASLAIKNLYGRTARMIAARKRYPEIEAYLEEEEKKYTSDLKK